MDSIANPLWNWNKAGSEKEKSSQGRDRIRLYQLLTTVSTFANASFHGVKINRNRQNQA